MILYSTRFSTFPGTSDIRDKDKARPALGFAVGSQISDAWDPNLRHRVVSEKITTAGTYCLCLRARPRQQRSASGLVLIGANWGQGTLRYVDEAENVLHTFGFVTLDRNGSFLGVLPNDIRFFALEAQVTLKVGDTLSAAFVGAPVLERMPRDPNSTKTEHLRLGLRSEFPGQQFHQEGLGTFRRFTMNWERLSADDLRALDQAYHTNPALEAPVALYDDSDPQGMMYGRFIGFDWTSNAFELTYDAEMVFEEIVVP